MKNLVVHTDGGCRDNPGPGAWAFVLHYSSGEIKEFSGFLPHCTNNQAEYRALEAVCLMLCQTGALAGHVTVSILSDSQLIVEQINGRWKVKDEVLRPFYASARAAYGALAEKCDLNLTWFRRENNTKADALCNAVMDRRGIVCSRKGTTRD